MGGWPDGRPGLFGRPFLASASAALLLVGAAAAQDCPEPSLTARASGAGVVAVALRAPCSPYAEVAIRFGAIAFREETGIDGGLDLLLPLPPGETDLTARLGDRTFAAPLPDDVAPARFLAVIWPEAGSWGALLADGLPVRRLGFPRSGNAAAVDLVNWPDGSQPPLRIEARVADATCGGEVTAMLASADHPDPRILTLDMPVCAAAGQRVVVPVVP